MNTVISTLLLFTYNTLNQDIYYSIAIYILDHLDEIETISINELSQNCHTSVPTINNSFVFPYFSVHFSNFIKK